MQNLINQLLQPKLGEDRPSTLNRRAAEALANALNRSQEDQQARLKAEQDSQQTLSMLEHCRQQLVVVDHAAAYKEAANRDYLENFT